MVNDKKFSLAALPVLFGFFVMGFCDIVGISSDYAASAFGWSQTMAGLVPSAVFVWFFFLGVPVGLLMNRIGRKNTVLLSMLVTVVGMVIPLVSYTSATTLVAYAFLGIGNAILQVSLNPLLNNVVTNEKLLTSTLTAGQVVKAVSSFMGPFIVLAAVSWFGGGDESKWYVCFPLMGGITLVSGLWLLLTPIEDERVQGSRFKVQGGVSLGETLALLKNPTILTLFFGIFFAVGTDVSTNFISSKVMITRFGYDKELAGTAPQVYFVLRTIGAFFGVFALSKIASLKYFKINIVACIVAVLGLAFVENEVVDYACIGAIGFLCSCVFPIVYGMALQSQPTKANEISGLMIMAVAGGTVSFLVGAATDAIGISGGVLVILLEVLYLTYCAFFVKN
ncbi:MAG: MFS transporter [Bacteroidaceae bacterium]|nr:MFS transporter [Bacteroidaceae bacterium]